MAVIAATRYTIIYQLERPFVYIVMFVNFLIDISAWDFLSCGQHYWFVSQLIYTEYPILFTNDNFKYLEKYRRHGKMFQMKVTW